MDGVGRNPKTMAAGPRRGSEDGPLRILLIANTLPPVDVSGVGEQVLQLAAGLAEAGCHVEVLGRREVGGGGSVRDSAPGSTVGTPAEGTPGDGSREEGAPGETSPGFVLSRRGAAGAKVWFPLTVVPAAWRALRRLRPHVVQVHESDGALAALLVRLLRPFLRPRPRLLALLQVSYAEERRAVRPLVAPDGRVMGQPGAVERRFRRGKGRLQVLLGRLTARLADRVLTPSRRTADEVAGDYGVGGGITVLPNVTGGLPVAARPLPPDLAAAADGAFLFVGRLRIRKGVEVLLEALDRLPPSPMPASPVGADAPSPAATSTSSGAPDPPPFSPPPTSPGEPAPGRRLEGRRPPGPELLIAGDGEHRAALEARVVELGLGDRVRFLGRCSAGDVRSLLRRCRALVVPSTYEGMPLVILEAMEAGVPVVASAVSGIPEVVVDGETGWLVPPEDPAALAAALAAARDGTEARRRGDAGRRRLDRRYRPHHAAALWLERHGSQ